MNCTPAAAGGYVILSEQMYQKYLSKLSTGNTIEVALIETCGTPVSGKFYYDADEFADADSDVKLANKYIFAYRQSGPGTGLIIVSSSIIAFNPRRGLVSIKPAYNYFDISACFAKPEDEFVKANAYDIKINTGTAPNPNPDPDIKYLGLNIDSGNKVYDIYYTLNLAQPGYSSGDIEYIALSASQFETYKTQIANGATKYDAITTAGTSTDFELGDIYIFAYVGDWSSGNVIFASHIINLNASLDYAILI